MSIPIGECLSLDWEPVYLGDEDEDDLLIMYEYYGTRIPQRGE